MLFKEETTTKYLKQKNKKLTILFIKQRKAILLMQSEQNKQMILYRILRGPELEFRGSV